MLVLVLNVGSSSLKSAVFEIAGEPDNTTGASESPRFVFGATVTTNGASQVATIRHDPARSTRRESIGGAGADGANAIGWLLNYLERERIAASLTAVGHRLVHGGRRFRGPTWLDTDALTDLRALADLAPDHLPMELAAIDLVATRLPNVRQAGCFDTAFHRDLPLRQDSSAYPAMSRTRA